MRADAARIARRVAELAAIGADGDAVTRLGLSQEEERARRLVGSWLAPLGARVRRDAAGNLWGRFGADGRAIVVGSHLDSVPEGGRFDGALGVVCAVEAMETIVASGAALDRPIEVVAWADEEGARFGIGLFGSSAAFGRLPSGAADRRDRDGVSIADALRALGEDGDPERARRAPGDVAGYLELHIEQGPRLERAGAPLAVVSDIVGISHGRVTVTGRADHAGATVMGGRADALAAAAEIVLAVERIAGAIADAVGTVGEIAVRPGAKNVVPGECTLSLDVRAPRQADLDRAVREIDEVIGAIAAARGVSAATEVLARVPATSLDRGMRELLARAARAVGVETAELISGAGHDAQNPQLAGVPTGMLFVRSTGGSHAPREQATAQDAVLGASALAVALRELAAHPAS